jgi:mono/diheme cytochrome c family protein
VISKGVRGVAMPAFAKSAGGMLTDQQVGILAEEMQKRWSKPAEFATLLCRIRGELGDVARGEAAFQTFCGSCHGPTVRESRKRPGRGESGLSCAGDRPGAALRVIAGRTDLGMPDFRGRVPDRSCSRRKLPT